MIIAKQYKSGIIQTADQRHNMRKVNEQFTLTLSIKWIFQEGRNSRVDKNQSLMQIKQNKQVNKEIETFSVLNFLNFCEE